MKNRLLAIPEDVYDNAEAAIKQRVVQERRTLELRKQLTNEFYIAQLELVAPDALYRPFVSSRLCFFWSILVVLSSIGCIWSWWFIAPAAFCLLIAYAFYDKNRAQVCVLGTHLAAVHFLLYNIFGYAEQYQEAAAALREATAGTAEPKFSVFLEFLQISDEWVGDQSHRFTAPV